MTKLVVFVSGHGSNLQAILDAIKSGDLKAQVVAVVSDNPSAFGLIRAHDHHVPTVVIEKGAKSNDQYGSELAHAVAPFNPDLVVLAGFMRKLSRTFLDHFKNRVINLHPALPGSFPGLRAIERALRAFKSGKITHTGVMIHYVVDEGIDSGPLIAQTSVSITAEDTLEILTVRVHETEHRLLVNTLIEMVKTNGLCTALSF
jgi:phosphoribosylglycinamide formyltransferase-1